jgi:predicted small lipoprotein YifL
MKTILVMAAVLALAGCQKKGTASGADTSAMAPAASDTGMGGGMTHSDSTMARDTTKK